MPSIQHARDIGMSERGENLPFLQKALALGIAGARWEQLHGQALGHFAVRALGQVDCTHAAASDYVQQPVWPAAPALNFELRKGPAGSNANVAQQKRARPRIEG